MMGNLGEGVGHGYVLSQYYFDGTILTLSRATAQYCAATAIKKTTFYLTIDVFGVNNTLFRGKVFCMHAQELFTKNVFPQRGNALFLRNTAI